MNNCIEDRHGAVLQFRPRPPRIDVRISAAAGREPYGRTRPLRLTEPDFAWLIETAEMLEARA